MNLRKEYHGFINFGVAIGFAKVSCHLCAGTCRRYANRTCYTVALSGNLRFNFVSNIFRACKVVFEAFQIKVCLINRSLFYFGGYRKKNLSNSFGGFFIQTKVWRHQNNIGAHFECPKSRGTCADTKFSCFIGSCGNHASSQHRRANTHRLPFKLWVAGYFDRCEERIHVDVHDERTRHNFF